METLHGFPLRELIFESDTLQLLQLSIDCKIKGLIAVFRGLSILSLIEIAFCTAVMRGEVEKFR